MRVSLGHPPVLVTKKLLNHIHIISSLYEIRCEVMTEVVEPEVRDPCALPPLSIFLEIGSVSSADKTKLNIAVRNVVMKAISETGSKIFVDEIMSRMTHARYIDPAGTPLVTKRELYTKIRQIIKDDIQYCKYCAAEIENWSHSNRIKYHASCRSERYHRLKKMKDREARLSDGRRVVIIDAQKGTFIVKHRVSGTTFEVRDRRSTRDDLPLIESYASR
jgi:hypothetical protein